MASTNEDVVVLATAPLGDDRLLIMRHLPDRGTIEIGWWEREESGSIAPGPAVLELAAEAVELGAVARLCEELAGAGWEAAGEGERLAETHPFTDGAHVAAVRSGDGVMLVRHPEGGNLVLLPGGAWPAHRAVPDRPAAARDAWPRADAARRSRLIRDRLEQVSSRLGTGHWHAHAAACLVALQQGLRSTLGTATAYRSNKAAMQHD